MKEVAAQPLNDLIWMMDSKMRLNAAQIQWVNLILQRPEHYLTRDNSDLMTRYSAVVKACMQLLVTIASRVPGAEDDKPVEMVKGPATPSPLVIHQPLEVYSKERVVKVVSIALHPLVWNSDPNLKMDLLHINAIIHLLANPQQHVQRGDPGLFKVYEQVIHSIEDLMKYFQSHM